MAERDRWLPLRLTREARLIELEQVLTAAARRTYGVWLARARQVALPRQRAAVTAALPPAPAGIPGTRQAWMQAVAAHLHVAVRDVFDAGAGDAGVDVLAVEAARREWLRLLDNDLDGVPDAAWKRVTAAIADLTQQGASITRIRDAVADILSPSNWDGDAVSLARTLTVGAYNGGTHAAWLQLAAVSEEDTDKVWVSTHDNRTRPDHADADGQRVALAGSFMVGDVPMPYPGYPGAPLEQRISCRCTMIEVAAGEPLPQVPNHPWPRRDDTGPVIVVTAAGNTTKEKRMARMWEGPICEIGVVPGDKAWMLAKAAELSTRDLPLPLRWQRESAAEHDNAVTVGRILEAEVRGGIWWGRGDWLDSVPESFEAYDLTEAGVLYPSVDLDDVEFELATYDGQMLGDPSELSEEEFEQAWDNGILPAFTKAKLIAVTMVATQKFEGARVSVATTDGEPEPEAVAASGVTTGTATARQAAPVLPPRAWFEKEEAGELTPITVTASGQVYGHATDRDCHMGYLGDGMCVLPPDDVWHFDWYHCGEVECDDGSLVAVGRISTGTGHAPLGWSASKTIAHYDNTGHQAAIVRASRGRFGIWLAGSLVPEATTAQAQEVRRSPLSPDWRVIDGKRQVVAMLAVNQPGYPVVRGRISRGRVVALTASGWPGWRPSTGRASPAGGQVPLTALTAAVGRAVDEALRRDRQARRIRVQAEQVAASIGRDRESVIGELERMVRG